MWEPGKGGAGSVRAEDLEGEAILVMKSFQGKTTRSPWNTVVATAIDMGAPIAKGYKNFSDVIWLEEIRREVFFPWCSWQQGGGLDRAEVEPR